jgi:hypothetical protein
MCSGKIYVGSTILAMNLRMTKHRYQKRCAAYKHFTVCGWDKADISVICEIGVDTVVDLFMKEREWFDLYKEAGYELINRQRPWVSEAERKENRRPKDMVAHKAKRHAYYLEHKTELNAKRTIALRVAKQRKSLILAAEAQVSQ